MNSALASLTETYTDSENEDNHEDDVSRLDPEEKQIKAEIIIQPKKSSKHPRRLVSYNDNEAHEDASDDELNTSEEIPPEKDNETEEEEDGGDKFAKYFKKYGFHLPPEPKTKSDPKLQETISNIYQKIKNSEFDLNQYIQEKKEFRNPSIYDKLIQFFDLNELGTNFPPEIYDVSIYGPESYYEELAKAQKQEMDKLEKQKKENIKTEVIVKESTKRKSKWDQQAPVSVTSSITTSSSSTSGKTTVISAFGTLKKPKV
ncbi:CLUMA_CG007003, isoform A [Clunio marinus]|uniref:CLUMA_CG007003, isoform A n=1 Tax=Clunio marinus TaxID=568069 RepID=A0A1J1HZS6_9DIPT|nr:CLUMA_CG007003, isoform A [Clunio marinus]